MTDRPADSHDPSCIRDLLAGQAAEAPAIPAPGRRPLSDGQLAQQVERTATSLNAMGLGRGDRVAVVLPNGPEMAVAFLAVAAGATCAPLNPGYRGPEFDFYLSDLGARALIVAARAGSPVRAVAQARGIPVVELLAGPDDVTLVLHTSGTTSRPKMVPLTHANLCASAARWRSALRTAA